MTDEVLDDPRITAMGLFAEAYTGVIARLACQTARHDLSQVEFEVLLRLGRSPDGQLRMTDLAAQTSLTASGVTRVIDRLERDRLVARTACPTDRRSLYAVITQSGRTRLTDVLPGHVELIAQWFTDVLDPAELDALLGAMRKIRDRVRPEAVAGAHGGADALPR